MTIGEKITRCLAEIGRNQYDLAAAIKRTQSRVSKWVSGTGAPKPEDLLGMSRFLGVSLEFLCDPSLSDPKQSPISSAGSAAGLSEKEHALIVLARQLGPDEAFRRLLLSSQSAAPSELPPVGRPLVRPATESRKPTPKNHHKPASK